MNMKKKFIASILIITILAVSVMTFTGCDSFVNSYTPDPQPHYTIDKTSTRTPGGMILKDGKLYLKDMETGNAVTQTMDIDQKTNGIIDADKQANAVVQAVMENKMPVFSLDTFAPVRLAWDGENTATGKKTFEMSAISILQYIIKDTMTDVEKVLAIHDYLSFKVVYDMDIYEAAIRNEGEDVSGKPAFNIIGAIFSNQAVCDGISSAFSLLCRLEGITAVRVVGRVLRLDSETGIPITSGGNEISGLTYVDHAWNKVYIDTTDDSIDNKEWYNIDCTYDRVNIKTSENIIKSYLSHAYFLKTNAEIAAYVPGTKEYSGQNFSYYETREQGNFVGNLNYNGGIERFKGDNSIADYDYGAMTDEEIAAVVLTPAYTQYYESYTPYDFYGKKTVTLGNQSYSMKINSTQELNDLFTAIKKANKTVGKIELILNYQEGVDKTTNVFNAYKLINNASNVASNAPWVRRPNDVYYVFIYS